MAITLPTDPLNYSYVVSPQCVDNLWNRWVCLIVVVVAD